MDVYESTWWYMNVKCKKSENMEVYEALWWYMNAYESVWINMSQNDGIWKYMIVYIVKGSKWFYMKVYKALL